MTMCLLEVRGEVYGLNDTTPVWELRCTRVLDHSQGCRCHHSKVLQRQNRCAPVDTQMSYCIETNNALLSLTCVVVYPVTTVVRDADGLQATKIGHVLCTRNTSASHSLLDVLLEEVPISISPCTTSVCEWRDGMHRTRQSRIADFDPSPHAQFSGTTWRVTVNNSPCRRLQACISICPITLNMTSSTKPEVHNVLHCLHFRIEPQPQVICTENFVKCGRVVFSVSSRSLYAIARPSVVCLSSVTLVRPTQAVQIFGNISTALGTLAIR